MSSQALYNRWRGQTFADILGQEHITRTLQNQIQAGRVGHAYLFSGLRGTGKTSTARVMAKAVNCTGDADTPPCNRCPTCLAISKGHSLDLIEIDGASNRGIDEIRDLRDAVAYKPSEGRYRVYVIDEVHMLTREAFNALLKTLEEPPGHVIFILCTTDPASLPDTVLSRVQRYEFRRAAPALVETKLRRICADEGLQVEEQALAYIARRATGSFRDAESLLDQLAAHGAGGITMQLVHEVLGTVPSAQVVALLGHMLAGDITAGLRTIQEAFDAGAEPRQFAGDVVEHLRALMLLAVGGGDLPQALPQESLEDLAGLTRHPRFGLGVVVRALRLFNEAGVGARGAVRPQLLLELAFVEAATLGLGVAAAKQDSGPATGATVENASASPASTRVEPMPEGGDSSPTVSLTKEREEPSAVVAPYRGGMATPSQRAVRDREAVREQDEAPQAPEQPRLNLEWVQGNWKQVLMRIKAHSPQVQALLNSAQPVAVEGDKVILDCEAAFHRDMLSEDKKRDLVERVLQQVLGVPCRVSCQVLGTAGGEAGREAVGGVERRTASQGDRGEATAEAASALGADLFSASEERVRQLTDHPAVKRLQELGGRVERVELFDGEDDEEEPEDG